MGELVTQSFTQPVGELFSCPKPRKRPEGRLRSPRHDA